jgi:hypothetical protein
MSDKYKIRGQEGGNKNVFAIDSCVLAGGYRMGVSEKYSREVDSSGILLSEKKFNVR